jgi:hypothetical protein
MTFPCKLGGEKSAVAVGSQSCAASLSMRHRVFRRCGLPMAVRHEGDVIHVILS